MEKVKCIMEAQYNGHYIKGNGDLDLNFKLPYSELINVLKLTQMIGTNIKIAAKIGKKEVFELGTFMLKNISIDREGESKIKFNSEVSTVEMENFINLAEKDQIIKLRCEANVLEEEDPMEDDEDEDEEEDDDSDDDDEEDDDEDSEEDDEEDDE